MDVFSGLFLFLVSVVLALVVFALFIKFASTREIKNRAILYAGPSIIFGALSFVNAGFESLSSGDDRWGEILLQSISFSIVTYICIAITVSVYEFLQRNRK